MTSRTLGRVAAATFAAFGPLARVGWLAPAALAIAVALYDLSLARNHLVGVSGDDAYYLVLAQALATGHGLVVLSLPWTPPETSVPPGFPLLLAPLVAITSVHSPVLQLVPLIFAALAAPLTYVYLREVGLPSPSALAGAALVGFNPSLGLYATIVMPETMFVCTLLALLLLVRRWRQAPAISGWGFGTAAATLALFELKLAAVLLLAPLIAFLFAVGRRTHALVLAVLMSAAAFPLLAVRLASRASLAGTTYDADFANAYGGKHGITLVLAVAATAVHNMVTLVYPTLAETVTGLAPVALASGVAVIAVAAVRDGLLALLTMAMLAGTWLLWHRTRDAGAVVVPSYLLLVTIYPIMNTRRTILVLPVLVTWLVLGLTEAHRLAGRAPLALTKVGRWRAGLAVLMVVAAALPTMGVNFHNWRNYQADRNIKLIPDRPWLRYLDQHAAPGDLVEVFYPRQVYLAIGIHADSSLWKACTEVGRQGSRAPFDEVLSRLRPGFVVAAGTPEDCVPDLIRGDSEYRRAFVDPEDGVTIWMRSRPGQSDSSVRASAAVTPSP